MKYCIVDAANDICTNVTNYGDILIPLYLLVAV